LQNQRKIYRNQQKSTETTTGSQRKINDQSLENQRKIHQQTTNGTYIGKEMENHRKTNGKYMEVNGIQQTTNGTCIGNQIEYHWNTNENYIEINANQQTTNRKATEINRMTPDTQQKTNGKTTD
jgi:hypothetical protein